MALRLSVASEVPGRLVLEVPAVGLAVWLSNELPAAGISPGCGSKEVREHDDPKSGVPTAVSSDATEEDAVKVMIGVDPHKGSHTAVAIGGDEARLAKVQGRATRRQVDQL